ncbi:hypothetical protein KKE14_01580 [Patescibacteria group bacterium]|nr:hypothetical protein [Patescibacteria group bacterium]
MELEKVRKLEFSELRKEVVKTEHKIAETRAEILMHRTKNHRSLRALKQYLARLLTVKSERALLGVDTTPKSKKV